MIRHKPFSGPVLLTLGSVAAVCAAVAAPGFGAPDAPGESVTLAAASARSTPVVPVRGVVCAALPAALASQLGVDPLAATLVGSVVPGTPAAAAGLEQHDVLVEVGGEEASPEAVDAALESAGEVQIVLIRAGRPNVVILPDETEPPSRFTAADALPPEHPIVRLREIDHLRRTLDREADGVDRRRRELADERRALQDEARSAAEALHAACMEEAQTFFDERRKALYASVDEAFDAARAEPMAALRVDLEVALPFERVQAIDEGLHDLAHELEGEVLFQRVARDGAPSKSQLKRVGHMASARIHERMQEPWAEVTKRQGHHAERLGAEHDGRVEWVRERMASTRGELHERIDCAVERSLERFGKSLAQQLRAMDVPRSKEIEATLEDVAAQMDRYAAGFVTEATHALAAYQARVEGGRKSLVSELPTHIADSEAARAAFVAEVERLLAGPFEMDAEATLAPSEWRRGAAARTFVTELRAAFATALDAGSDDLRPEAKAILRGLHDEEERSDEAWLDLREVLSRLNSRAGDDCWKLEGPHLDGRFAPKTRGEVVMAD